MTTPLGIYYWDVHNNFGDLINPWLWPKYFPSLAFEDCAKRTDGVFEAMDKDLLVGIGSLINERFPQARNTYVLGSGVGYGSPPPFADTVNIYCVRGPKSAAKLGLEANKGIIDPGVLVNKYTQPKSQKKFAFSYMPQISSVVQCPNTWEEICDDINFGYLDPRHSVDQTLDEILDTEVLLTESMHGAIIAEALRVPWIPIVTRQEILSFKWQDWCESVELTYEPNFISPIYEPYKPSFLRNMKASLTAKRAKSQLKKAASVKPTLGKSAVLESKIAQLDDVLHRFEQDMLKR